MEDSTHFEDMLEERGISRQWVDLTVEDPDKVEEHDDGTRHYVKRIPEHGNRWLHIVVNIVEEPNKRVTAFFDRRLRREE